MTVPERQYPAAFNEAGEDHQARYQLALRYARPGSVILDAACGSGYGTYYLAAGSRCMAAVGVDVSAEAMAWARTHYAHPKVQFVQADLTEPLVGRLPHDRYDLITCFETVEHVPDGEQFVRRLAERLADDGLLLLSAPNEDVLPWATSENAFHFRHYTPQQLIDLARHSGLSIYEYYTQMLGALYPGLGGITNVLVCGRQPRPVRRLRPFESIIAHAQLLDASSNSLREPAALISIDRRFQELVARCVRLSEAFSLAQRGEVEAAMAHLEGLSEHDLPECLLVAVLRAQSYGEVVQHGRACERLLQEQERLGPAALAFVIEQLRLNPPVLSPPAAPPGQDDSLRALDRWQLLVDRQHFTDPTGWARFQQVLATIQATSVYLPALIDLDPSLPVARWTLGAVQGTMQGMAEAGYPQRLALYILGDGERLPYAGEYRQLLAGHYDAALAGFIERFKSADWISRAVYARWVAWCLYKAGRLDDALRVTGDALELYAHNADLLLVRLAVLLALRQEQAAAGVLARIEEEGDALWFPEFVPNVAQVARRLVRDSEA